MFKDYADFTDLSKDEMKEGELLGKLRYQESRRLGLHNKAENYTPLMDYQGCCCEMGTAKILAINDFHPLVNTFKKPDIGVNLQVRGTSYWAGHLIIKPNDNMTHFYILCLCPHFPDASRFYLAGWIRGYEAKNFYSKIDSFGNWWIPQYKLYPMQDLYFEEDFSKNYEVTK